MKKYRTFLRLLKTFLIILFIQFNVFAQSGIQNNRKQAKEVNRETRKLSKELSLTKEQVSKVKNLMISVRNQVDTLWKENLSNEERRRLSMKRRGVLQRADSTFKSFLTPEQLTKWESKKQKDLKVRVTYEPELFKKKVRITYDR